MAKRYTLQKNSTCTTIESKVTLFTVVDNGAATAAYATVSAIDNISDECEITGGRFIDGIFNRGTYNRGEFYGGVFYGGTFNDGGLQGGRYYGGIFNGGEFYGGTFNDGVFYDGVFYSGTYNGGIFRGGEFRGGVYYGDEYCTHVGEPPILDNVCTDSEINATILGAGALYNQPPPESEDRLTDLMREIESDIVDDLMDNEIQKEQVKVNEEKVDTPESEDLLTKLFNERGIKVAGKGPQQEQSTINVNITAPSGYTIIVFDSTGAELCDIIDSTSLTFNG